MPPHATIRTSARSVTSHSRHGSITHAAEPPGLLQTVQGHVGDIRSLIYCGVCVKPLYEPFTLECGHTFCYSCLTQWFVNHRRKMTCPSCRAAVTHEPAPAYLLREIVQIFISRAELLEGDETTVEHMASKRAESDKVESDKRNTNPTTGGLFEGCFKKAAMLGRPIVDAEDGVDRCPYCAWELEDGMCLNCGGDDFDSDYDSDEVDARLRMDAAMDSMDTTTNTDTDSVDTEDYDTPPPYLFGMPISPVNRPHLNLEPLQQPHHVGIPHAHSRARDRHGSSSPITVEDSDEDDDSGDLDSEMDSFIVDDTIEEGGSETDQATVVGDHNYMTTDDDYAYNFPGGMANYDLGLDGSEGDEDVDEQPIRAPPTMAQRRQQTRQNGQPYPQNSLRSRIRPSGSTANLYTARPQLASGTRHTTINISDDDDDSDNSPPRPANRTRRGPRERRRPSQRRSRNRRNNARAC